MRLHIACIGCLLACWTTAFAQDISHIYSQETLKYWGGRHQRTTTKILDTVIWPAMRPKERAAFGNRKPTLEFPLYAEGDMRRHPLAFYVPGDRRNIVFPAFSTKFLDDLCTAYAWLQVRGYSLESISEYTAIIAYGEPDTEIPPPLVALGVPENSLEEDPQVEELALGHFVTARTFLLAHEIAHAMYHHSPVSSSVSIANEIQADRFAAELMSRTPLPPLGILVFFMADAHWSGYPVGKSHPLTGRRVSALSNHVSDPVLALKLHQLGSLLDDPEIRAGFVATGRASDLAALGPRRPGELPRRREASRSARNGQPFHGDFRGEIVQQGDPIPAEFSLRRTGNEVTGSFSFGLSVGTIEGYVSDGDLYFDWDWAKDFGKGVLRATSSGFEGEWGYRLLRSGAGTWKAAASR